MDTLHLDQMKEFTLENIPNLDIVVLAALELFIKHPVPKLELGKGKRPLVVGSGNAAVAGRIIYEEKDAIFADEGTYLRKLEAVDDIDYALLISASGSKHAIPIADELKKRALDIHLLTNNPHAPARNCIGEENTLTYPKNREPYTYNTSTYMGMILGKSREDPSKILDWINNKVKGLIPTTIGSYDSYFLLVGPKFDNVRELFLTKFDELFGPLVNGRIFTPEQIKHAKTVVSSDKEYFISFGVENKDYGREENRLFIPLPEWAGPATCMAVGYYVIGKIQAQKPAWFKEHIEQYCKEASKIFGKELKPIVE